MVPVEFVYEKIGAYPPIEKIYRNYQSTLLKLKEQYKTETSPEKTLISMLNTKFKEKNMLLK